MIRLRTLGALDLRDSDGQELRGVPSQPKRAALLVYLALARPRGYHRRDTLIALFWPEYDEDRARNALSQAVHFLRRLLGAETIMSRNGDELGLDTGHIACDVVAFEDALDAGRSAEGVDLYRGELLEGFHISAAPGFERWLADERTRLADRYVLAVEALAKKLESLGDFVGAVSWWRLLAARDLYNSRVSLQLMRAMTAAGDPAGAVQHARRHETLLREDLNVAPDPQVADFVRQLEAGIVRPGPGARHIGTLGSLPDTSSVMTRNGRRERSRISPVPSRRLVFPSTTNVIIGRETEMVELERLLQRSRLVTVLGGGGVGKTHLALSLARRQQTKEPGSCAVVSLAGIDALSLASTVAEALGFTFAGRRDPAGQLIDHLRDKRLLLVLDNFEHLTSESPFLSDVLAQTAEVRCLVTSRERLGLRDETVFELEGLRLADEGTGLSDAAQLFLHAAARVRRRFRPTPSDVTNINRICDLLAGMPLGIEMAAALLRVLECEGIVRELERSFDALEADLRDVPERHRTLRAVFDYSWDLIEERQREGLCRLALFRGAFDQNGALEVGGVSLHVLAALTDTSMIRRTADGRFVMHPVFRQYAEERLRERGDTARAATDCYVRFFARLMRSREQSLCGPSHGSALPALTDEITDFRAAWSAAVVWSDETALRDLVDGLFQVYDLRGWYREGQAVIDDAMTRGSLSTFMLAKLLTHRARFSFYLSQLGDAVELADRSYRIFRSLVAEREAATALLHRARADYRAGRFVDAENVIRQALQAFEPEDAAHERAGALNDLGYVLAAQGRTSDAAETLRTSLDLFEQTGDSWGQAKVLNNLGAVLDGADTHAESMELFERGLRMHQQIGDRRGVGISLHNVARCAHFLGDAARARSFAEASLEIARDIGAPVDLSNFLGTLAEIELNAGRLEQAVRCYQEALAVANSAGITSLALQHVVDIGRLFVHIGDPAAAVEALSLAASHPAIDRSYRDAATEMLAAALRQLPPDRRPREDQVSADLKAFALSFDAEVARRFRPGAPAMRPEPGPEVSWTNTL